MNPHQKNKVDIASLTPDEQRLFRLYGKLPSRTDHLAKHLKERKYFDSGDYALSKAGKASSVDTGSVGSEHPLPENIPHLSSPGVGGVQGGSGNGNVIGGSFSGGGQGGMVGGGAAGSPVKQESWLQRETSVDEVDEQSTSRGGEQAQTDMGVEAVSPPAVRGGIPIRKN